MIAGNEFGGGGDFFLTAVRPVGQPNGGGGDQLDQGLGGLSRSLAGIHLQKAAGKQEEYEHGYRVEIDHAAAAEGGIDAGGVGSANAQGHRHIHAGPPQAQVAPGAEKERPGRVEHHRGGQQHAGRAHQGLDVRRHGVGTRHVERDGVHHDLHHAQAGDGQAANGGFTFLAEQRFLTAGVEWVGQVADLLHRLEDMGKLDPAVVPAYPCAMGGKVDVGGQHAGQLSKVPLVQPDAGGADDALQYQVGLANIALALHEALLDLGQVIQLELFKLIQRGLGRLGQVGAQPVIVGVAGIDDGLGHRLTAAAAGGPVLVRKTDRIRRSRRDGLATMKAALGSGAGRGDGIGHDRHFNELTPVQYAHGPLVDVAYPIPGARIGPGRCQRPVGGGR